MKKLITCFCMFIFMAAFLKANLMITPQSVIFESDDKKRTKSIKVIYKGDTKMTYRLSLIHYKQLPNGKLEKVESPAINEFFADDVIRFSPRTITLYPANEAATDPNKSSFQLVRIRKAFPTATPNGEYRSHLLIKPIPNPLEPKKKNTEEATGISFNIQILMGISIPVIVRKGNLEAGVSIQNITATQNEEKNATIKCDLLRMGKRSIRGDLKILVNGEVAGLLNECALYLSIDKRSIEIPLYKDLTNQISFKYKDLIGKKITINYEEAKNKKIIVSANETIILKN